MKKEKISKEVMAVIKALNNYVDKHKGNCVLNISIAAFDDENNVIDDRLLLYGHKDILLIANESMLNDIKQDKTEFINY
jgi:hypothetical protein